MKINLHIERVVIAGLPVAPHEAPRVQAAIEAELARLLSAGGLPLAPLQDRDVGRGRAFARGDASALGAQIGRAIYERIG